MKFSRDRLDRKKFKPGKLYLLTGIGWGVPTGSSIDRTIVGYEGVGEVEVSGRDYHLLHRFVSDGVRDITPDLEKTFCSVMNLLLITDAEVL